MCKVSAAGRIQITGMVSMEGAAMATANLEYLFSYTWA
jgi:hypothetical protein